MRVKKQVKARLDFYKGISAAIDYTIEDYNKDKIDFYEAITTIKEIVDYKIDKSKFNFGIGKK